MRRLLASTEGDHGTDIRDRAIILVLAVYGLRSSEVRRLRLDDLDWEHERLLIRRSKPRAHTQVYPLVRTVGDAILRYVQEARPPCPWRELWVATKAPVQPLSNSAIWRLHSWSNDSGTSSTLHSVERLKRRFASPQPSFW